jgi:hypothetical protein
VKDHLLEDGSLRLWNDTRWKNYNQEASLSLRTQVMATMMFACAPSRCVGGAEKAIRPKPYRFESCTSAQGQITDPWIRKKRAKSMYFFFQDQNRKTP